MARGVFSTSNYFKYSGGYVYNHSESERILKKPAEVDLSDKSLHKLSALILMGAQ